MSSSWFMINYLDSKNTSYKCPTHDMAQPQNLITLIKKVASKKKIFIKEYQCSNALF